MAGWLSRLFSGGDKSSGDLIHGEPLRHWLKLLRDPNECTGALIALAWEGPRNRQTVAAIGKLLEDRRKHPSDRAAAADALAEFGPAARDAVPALIAVFNEGEAGVRARDANACIRVAAARALGRIGRGIEGGVPALFRAFDAEEHWDARASIACSLARLGKDELSNLIEIVRIGPDALQAIFEQLAADMDAVCWSGKSACNWRVRREAALALGTLGPAAHDAVPALIVMLRDPHREKPGGASGESRFPSEACWALGQIGKAAIAAVPELIESLDDWDSFVQKEATEALTRVGSDALAVLVQRLQQETQAGHYYGLKQRLDEIIEAIKSARILVANQAPLVGLRNARRT